MGSGVYVAVGGDRMVRKTRRRLGRVLSVARHDGRRLTSLFRRTLVLDCEGYRAENLRPERVRNSVPCFVLVCEK